MFSTFLSDGFFSGSEFKEFFNHPGRWLLVIVHVCTI